MARLGQADGEKQMMRIGSGYGGERVELEGLKDREKGEPAHVDFKQLLDRELSSSSAKEADASSRLQSSGSVSVLHEIFPMRTGQAHAVESSVLEGVQHAEMILDGIGTDLNNGRVTSKEMEGVVKSLSDASRQLGASLEGIPDDHPLNRVGQDLSVLAFVESVKWRRGDYME